MTSGSYVYPNRTRSNITDSRSCPTQINKTRSLDSPTQQIPPSFPLLSTGSTPQLPLVFPYPLYQKLASITQSFLLREAKLALARRKQAEEESENPKEGSENMLNISNHWGNAYQNHNENTSHPSGWLLQKVRKGWRNEGRRRKERERKEGERNKEWGGRRRGEERERKEGGRKERRKEEGKKTASVGKDVEK